MKKGIHYLYGMKNSNEKDLRSIIRNLVEQGCDLIEIPPDPFFAGENIVEFRKYVNDLGAEIAFCCGLPEDCDLTSDNTECHKNGIAYVHRIIDLMARSGITLMTGSSWTPWPNIHKGILLAEEKEIILERTAKIYAEAIKPVCDFGIKVAIEPMNRFENYLINTSTEGILFCNLVGNDNLGLLLDCFHMSIEENNLQDAIFTAGKKLFHLHLAERNRALPGMGDFDWDGLFQALYRINYSGCLGIESFVVSGGDVAASVSLWRDLSGGMGENELNKMLRDSLLFLDKKQKTIYNQE